MSVHSLRSVGRACALLLAWFAPIAAAESLTVEAALQRSLAAHPDARAATFDLTALQQQVESEALPPPITFEATLDNLAGTGAVSGLHGVEATVGLSRTFERGGKAAARRARGDARVATQILRQRLLHLDLELRVRQRHVALLQAQALQTLADAQHMLALTTAAEVQTRVQRGASADSEGDWARISVAEAELAQEHARHERRAAAYALAAMWGATQPGELAAVGDLLALPELAGYAEWETRLARSADFALHDHTALELDSTAVVARSAAHADWRVGAGIRRLEALDDQAFVLSFSLPLGNARRAAPLQAQWAAERAALDARRESLLLEARQRLYALLQELNHARSEVDRLIQTMLPAAERALAATREGFEQGRHGVLPLTQAQATVLRLKQAQVTAAGRFHTLWAELQRSVASPEARP